MKRSVLAILLRLLTLSSFAVAAAEGQYPPLVLPDPNGQPSGGLVKANANPSGASRLFPDIQLTDLQISGVSAYRIAYPVALSVAQAKVTISGKCAFPISYHLKNGGVVPTKSFGTEVVVSGPSPSTKPQTGFALNPGMAQTVETQVWLAPGAQTLKVAADPNDAIPELREDNNTSSAQVTVAGPCSGKDPNVPLPGGVNSIQHPGAVRRAPLSRTENAASSPAVSDKAPVVVTSTHLPTKPEECAILAPPQIAKVPQRLAPAKLSAQLSNQKPDLTMDWMVMSNTVNGGGYYPAVWVLENIGEGSSPPTSVKVTCQEYSAGACVAIPSSVAVPPLKAHQYCGLVPYWATKPALEKSVTMVIDPANDIAEANESNNSYGP